MKDTIFNKGSPSCPNVGSDNTLREVDSGCKRIAAFMAKSMLQRFGHSNPSPDLINTVAWAYRNGDYMGIGSRKYGDLDGRRRCPRQRRSCRECHKVQDLQSSRIAQEYERNTCPQSQLSTPYFSQSGRPRSHPCTETQHPVQVDRTRNSASVNLDDSSNVACPKIIVFLRCHRRIHTANETLPDHIIFRGWGPRKSYVLVNQDATRASATDCCTSRSHSAFSHVEFAYPSWPEKVVR